MSTRITFIFGNPTDPEAFETAFSGGHLELATRLPGVRRVESARAWPKEDGSPTPAHRLIDLYFDDYDAACAAVTTTEAGQLFGAAFGIATGGLEILFSDVEPDTIT
jgi:uncharacterized protein (TIGR02118 family)